MKRGSIKKSLNRLYGLLLSNVFCYRKTMTMLYKIALQPTNKTIYFLVNFACKITRAVVTHTGWDMKICNPHKSFNHNDF